MGFEIERKFLVNKLFEGVKVRYAGTHIRQAYLSVDSARTIRLRISGNRAFLTIKSGYSAGSFSHKEWEFEVALDDAVEMLGICLPGIIEKTRYEIPAGAHTFEVDVFHGKNEGLIIAEVELKSESEVFQKPEWLGEEVTGNPAYYNSNLIG